MSVVRCAKCGQDKEGLSAPPFGGDLGRKVQTQVCQACWGEWIGRQTMLINEYRMNVVDPKAQDLLMSEMKSFLLLG